MYLINNKIIIIHGIKFIEFILSMIYNVIIVLATSTNRVLKLSVYGEYRLKYRISFRFCEHVCF